MKKKLQQSEKRHKNVNLGDKIDKLVKESRKLVEKNSQKVTDLWRKSHKLLKKYHKKWQISEKISQKVAN